MSGMFRTNNVIQVYPVRKIITLIRYSFDLDDFSTRQGDRSEIVKLRKFYPTIIRY